MLITEEQKRRYTAFWNREPLDRACLYLTSWDGSAPFRAPKDPEEQWGDLAFREEQIVYNTLHTQFHAEGFPSIFTNFGPGSLAACIGGSYKFAPATVWFENEPFFAADWETRPPVKLDRESKMFRMIEEMTSRELRHKDLFITSISDIGGTYDVVASLRGTQNLLYDMYDDPEEVKKLRDEIAPIWKEYYLEYSSLLLREQGCMSSWQPIWSDKSYYPLQCDYSAMISPDMFREFVLPDLREQTEYMDRSIYHLDGPGEIPHIDLILSLPRLSAIQWVSGAGNAPNTDPCWFDLLRRIQKAGKGVILLEVDPAELETLFKNISQRGLYICANVRDAQEAREVVEMAKKLNF
ncbi:MAG: hypothetical protein IJM21_00220 [Clostridia bacterium]|nr:hypothetical protein [Clostridia bacterium]